MVPFTAADTALVLIDHQVGTAQLVRNIPQAHLRTATLALARAARILGLPVVLTSSQEDRVQGPLWPELADLLPEAYAARVRRAGVVNAWQDIAFRDAVQATGRRNLLMAGLTTDVCLVFPAIEAVEAGFRVQAVMDASGSPFPWSEAASQQRMTGAGVVLTASNTAIAELAQDWSTPSGAQLIGVLFSGLLPTIETAR